MPTPFKLGEIQVNIPSGYHELTLNQFIALSKLDDLNDHCTILSIFTGIDKKVWNDADLNSFNIAMLNQALLWSRNKINWQQYPVPLKITLGEKELEIPTRIELKTFGQKSAFDRFVTYHIQTNENGEGSLPPELMPDAIAIYLQPEYTKEKFNSDKLAEIKALVGNLPATQAIPLAGFFLQKLLDLKSVKIKSNTRRTKILWLR